MTTFYNRLLGFLQEAKEAYTVMVAAYFCHSRNLSYCPFISGHGGGADTPAPPEAVEQVQYIDGKELLSKIKVKLYTVHCKHHMLVFMPHCKEIPRKGIARLSPNFHTHVPVSNLHIPKFGPPTSRQTIRGIHIIRSQKHECRNWDCSLQFLFWKYLFRIFGIVSLQRTKQIFASGVQGRIIKSPTKLLVKILFPESLLQKSKNII